MSDYPGILSNLSTNALQLLDQVMIETDLSEGSILFKQRDEAAGGFMKIVDQGAADQLISASSPIADEVQLHTMTMEDNVMKMRQAHSSLLSL